MTEMFDSLADQAKDLLDSDQAKNLRPSTATRSTPLSTRPPTRSTT